MNVISDDLHTFGRSVPTIASVEKANGPYSIVVTWASGSRAGRADVIDVATQILGFKVYKPLREDADLFAKVTLSEDATAVIWPGNEDLEISADALEEFAEQNMTSDEFANFMKDMGWTFDVAAAQLGISRRQVAYYAKNREVPRLVALACKALRLEGQAGAGTEEDRQSARSAHVSESGRVVSLQHRRKAG